MNLIEKSVVVTGANGFLGRHIISELETRGLTESSFYRDIPVSEMGPGRVLTFGSAQFDLTKEASVQEMYSECKPQVIIHLAARVGGIGINRKKPGTFYYDNLMMGTLLMEYARHNNVEKFVAIGSICAYPKHTPVPFKEEDLWVGFPEETNAPYGIAKKGMLVQGQAYRQEFGFNSIYLLPVNLYGPGDNFNPETSHVIPALIKKCVEARDSGASHIECWGTGQATREFLYVEDAAKAIVLAAEKYDGAEPINVGSGHEVPISILVETIARLVKFKGAIKWNAAYPDGQPRRCLDVARAKKEFNFQAMTTLEDGLAKTVEWYEKSCN